MTTVFPRAAAPAPRFNYELLEGIPVDTEELGKARVLMIMKFMEQAIRWGLEVHVNTQRNGKIAPDQGCQPILLRNTTFAFVEQEDEEIYELITMDHEGRPVGDMFFRDVIRLLIGKNDIDVNQEDGTLMPTWEVPTQEQPEDSELQDQELDGVSYPLVANFSPEEMVYWALHQEEFAQQFPNGNVEMLVATAKHLAYGQVYATSHEHCGKTSYLYTVRV